MGYPVETFTFQCHFCVTDVAISTGFGILIVFNKDVLKEHKV
jgi:hypothetical protein